MPFSDTEVLQRRAVAAALEMIARRDHTIQEVARKLGAKGFDAAACEAAVARCRQLGYLDDARTAKALVAALRRRGLGAHRIRAQLRDKGIDGGTIAALTADDDDPDCALAAARKVCDRKRAALARETDPTRRRAKLYRFLRSRGFPADTIHRLLEDED